MDRMYPARGSARASGLSVEWHEGERGHRGEGRAKLPIDGLGGRRGEVECWGCALQCDKQMARTRFGIVVQGQMFW